MGLSSIKSLLENVSQNSFRVELQINAVNHKMKTSFHMKLNKLNLVSPLMLFLDPRDLLDVSYALLSM